MPARADQPIHRPSALFLLWQLCIGGFERPNGATRLKHRLKFALRSLASPSLTLTWLATFLSDDTMLAYLRNNPRVAGKLHRPYLRASTPMAERLAALQAHYRFERERFPRHRSAQLLGNRDLTLAICNGRDDSRFALVLTHNHNCDKEGELSLQLHDPAGLPLVYLTFSAIRDATGYLFVIGGLQGPRRHDGDAATIRQATRALNGLFPKRIVLEALTMLAQVLHVARVEAIGKQAHVYNCKRYRRRIAADYDGFYREIGGVALPNGHFLLPERIARKPVDAIASKKRAEYARRYALLNDIERQLQVTLRPAETGPGHAGTPGVASRSARSGALH